VALPREGTLASNGWAIGAERSASGKGMVVGNPHFPWEGELRLWESHLTIPGQLNVYGVSLMGTPGVLIGFNDNVAWTHTFSSGQRFSMYVLKLVSGQPTRYQYGNETRAMEARQVQVSVLQQNGSQVVVPRTVYFSHYGPIITLPQPTGAPLANIFAWTNDFALTYRDANLDNKVFINQFLGMDRAKSLAEFQQNFATIQGIPWVNTMATDRDGNVWYADASATPNHSPASLQGWGVAIANPTADPATTQMNLRIATLAAGGVVAFDGSNPANEWVTEAGSRDPGLVPYARVPKLSRRDFVFNANDSYWLANPSAPVPQLSPLQGLAGVPQSLRTRMNLVMLTEQRASGASGADGKFSFQELKDAILSNRSMSEELARADVVTRCKAGGEAVADACGVLERWNGRFDVDSRGAVLWRELTAALSPREPVNAGSFFSVPFDPEELAPHPVHRRGYRRGPGAHREDHPGQPGPFGRFALAPRGRSVSPLP
jgi:acyl-homoserine-lactone acylase